MNKNLVRILSLALALLLLPVPAQAASFNANDFSINGSNDSFTVTIGAGNGPVLEAEAAAGQTAEATVSCPFESAYVLHNNEILEPRLENSSITFPIPSAGEYRIVSGSLIHIANTNMVLGNSLALNFWIRRSDIPNEDCYAVITRQYADDREPAYQKIAFDQWQQDNPDYYRVRFAGIAAKEMCDTVSVQIFQNDGTPVSYLYTDSVRGYAMDMLKYYRSGKLATVLVDMLNYGAAAQNHFEYGQDDLANSLLSESQQALASQSASAENQQTIGDKYFGNSLSLKNNIVLNLYFRDVTEDMRAEVSFTDHYGRDHLIEIPYTDFSTMTYGTTELRGVCVEELVVADGRIPVTCTLYNGEGEAAGSCVSSVESYLAQKMGGTDPLYEATMKFVDSAYAYFHS